MLSRLARYLPLIATFAAFAIDTRRHAMLLTRFDAI